LAVSSLKIKYSEIGWQYFLLDPEIKNEFSDIKGKNRMERFFRGTWKPKKEKNNHIYLL